MRNDKAHYYRGVLGCGSSDTGSDYSAQIRVGPMTLLTCLYCPRPVRHKLATTCDDPKCIAKRRAANSRRTAEKRQIGLLPPREGSKYYLPKFSHGIITRNCSECGQEYQTEKTIDGFPVFRRCPDCRELMAEKAVGMAYVNAG